MIKYFAPQPLKGVKAIRSGGAKGAKCDRIQGRGYPPLTDGCSGGVGNTLSLRFSAAAPPSPALFPLPPPPPPHHHHPPHPSQSTGTLIDWVSPTEQLERGSDICYRVDTE